MPIYVYRCAECGEVKELLRKMDDMNKPIFCAECEFLGEHEAPMKRMVSACDSIFKKRWIPTKDGWIDGSE